MRLASAAVLVLLGCSEGPVPSVTAAASSSPTTTTPVVPVAAAELRRPPSDTPAPSTSASLVATANPSRRMAKVPVPTRMPDGGLRIDMRGTVRRVHTLERQADGKYKQACVTPPGAPDSQGTK